MEFVSKSAKYGLILLTVGLGSGYETDVHPIIGETRSYTLWGVLNTRADTQVVRLFPIDDTPDFDHHSDLDASVSSVDLTTGDRHTWKYRRRIGASGTKHTFWAPFTPIHGHTYRLDVERSDGALSSAETTVPHSDVEVLIDVRTTTFLIPVTILGADNVIGVGMTYEATNLPPLDVLPDTRPEVPVVFFPVSVSYEGSGTRIDGGWLYLINMEEDALDVRLAYERNCLVTRENPGIALRSVEFRFIVASEDWVPPGGVFDPEVLVQPGSFSNVTNGYGFLGSGEIYRVRWTPTRILSESLGYTYDRPASGVDPPIPCIGGMPWNPWGG